MLIIFISEWYEYNLLLYIIPLHLILQFLININKMENFFKLTQKQKESLQTSLLHVLLNYMDQL